MNCPHIRGHHCSHTACPGLADSPVRVGIRRLPHGPDHCRPIAGVNAGLAPGATVPEIEAALAASPLPEPEVYEPIPIGPARQAPTLPPGFPRKGGPGKVRVGLISPCLHQGGAEAWMLALARSCDPSRVSWLGCAVTGGDPAIDTGMRAQLEGLLPVAAGIGAAEALARSCDVLVGWAMDGLPAALRSAGSRAKVVSVCHSPIESPWGLDHNARASGVDRWVAVSELALPAIPEAVRATIPTSTIWNAVDPPRLEVGRAREAMRALWGVPEGAMVAGYLGRLSAEKDPHAMRRLIEHLPDGWHAVLVGSGAERIEPHPRLHLVGNDPRAGDVLGAFDVLVVPSHYESFGLTLAEGLWLGVPVVSTSVGIAKLRPGLTREVPQGADGETLAAAVLDAHDYGPMPGSHRWAREHLGPERFGKEWDDLILSFAPARPPGLLAMAGNLGRAVVAHAIDGGRKADPETQAARLAACEACPRLDPARDRCQSCGCIAMNLKRSWQSSECPEGRWPG